MVSDTPTVLSPVTSMPSKVTAKVLVSEELMLLVKVTVEGAVTVNFLLVAQVPSTDTSPDSPGASVAGTVTV